MRRAFAQPSITSAPSATPSQAPPASHRSPPPQPGAPVRTERAAGPERDRRRGAAALRGRGGARARGGGAPPPADERSALLGEHQESDSVEEAEQAQEHEARQPVGGPRRP